MSQPARPASTVVLLRPAVEGVEVFLVRRHDNVAFMGGAHVFPGGRVDASDYVSDAGIPDGDLDPRMRARTRAEAVAFQVAAVRELFEEAGILLARSALTPLTGDARRTIVSIDVAASDRFDQYRRALLDGTLTLGDMLHRERLHVALDALALFAHWVTPVVEARRFDTYFFLAIAPDWQDAAHDNRETTHGIWIRPTDALQQCLRGELALPPPTWTTLRALSRAGTVEDAWRWARAQRVARVQPCFQQNADGTRLVMLPGDPMCPEVEGFEADEKRFVLENGRWRPVSPS